MIPTLIISSLIGAAFLAVILYELRKKRAGRSSCSCGGNCGACQGCHTAKEN